MKNKSFFILLFLTLSELSTISAKSNYAYSIDGRYLRFRTIKDSALFKEHFENTKTLRARSKDSVFISNEYKHNSGTIFTTDSLKLKNYTVYYEKLISIYDIDSGLYSLLLQYDNFSIFEKKDNRLWDISEQELYNKDNLFCLLKTKLNEEQYDLLKRISGINQRVDKALSSTQNIYFYVIPQDNLGKRAQLTFKNDTILEIERFEIINHIYNKSIQDFLAKPCNFGYHPDLMQFFSYGLLFEGKDNILIARFMFGDQEYLFSFYSNDDERWHYYRGNYLDEDLKKILSKYINSAKN